MNSVRVLPLLLVLLICCFQVVHSQIFGCTSQFFCELGAECVQNSGAQGADYYTMCDNNKICTLSTVGISTYDMPTSGMSEGQYCNSYMCENGNCKRLGQTIKRAFWLNDVQGGNLVCNFTNRGLGAKCDSSSQCPGASSCVNGICQALGLGQNCNYGSFDNQNVAGGCNTSQNLICGSSYTCVNFPSEGEQCVFSSYQQLIAPCSSPNLYCNTNTQLCTNRTALGSPCQSDAECVSGAYCDGTCNTLKPIGASCSSSSQCDSTFCQKVSYSCHELACPVPDTGVCTDAVYSIVSIGSQNSYCNQFDGNPYCSYKSQGSNTAICPIPYGSIIPDLVFTMDQNLNASFTNCAFQKCGLIPKQALLAFFDPDNCMNIYCSDVMSQIIAKAKAIQAFSNGDESALISSSTFVHISAFVTGFIAIIAFLF